MGSPKTYYTDPNKSYHEPCCSRRTKLCCAVTWALILGTLLILFLAVLINTLVLKDPFQRKVLTSDEAVFAVGEDVEYTMELAAELAEAISYR